MFTYLNKSSDLTTQMIENYRNSIIVLADEKQMFIPLINSYIGLGVSTYNYIMSLINELTVKQVEYKYANSDHDYFLSFTYDPNGGAKYTYVNENIIFNPAQQYIKTSYFIGTLIGNSYTTTRLQKNVSLWGNTFNGTQNINGNIIPGGNHSRTLGNKDHYFAYAYIDSIIGNLYGNATTANSTPISYHSYMSYGMSTNHSGFFYVDFVSPIHGGEKDFFSYSYIDSNTSISLPGSKTASDLLNQNDIDIIRFKDFESPLLYSPYNNMLISTYFRGHFLGVSSYTDALYNSRKINGTEFDGTNDITTTYWGNSRKFRVNDNTNAHKGVQVDVHGDKDIVLNLPATLTADIIGKSTYATTSDLSDRTYKQQVFPTGTNKEYYITFTDKSAQTFAYSYLSGNFHYNPSSNTLTVSYFSGWLKGNADNAVKLLNKRKINGTEFDGTANITTTYWGNKRDITLSDNYSTYTYTNKNIDGGSNIILKLPNKIQADLKGNADTATWSNRARISNQTYRQQINHTSTNNTYYLEITNSTTGYSYTYYNQKLHYNPKDEQLTTSYYEALELFRGQIRAQDQWGTL